MKKKNKRWMVPVAFYLLALLIYVASCFVLWARDAVNLQDGLLNRRQLWLEDFTLVSVLQLATVDGKQSFVSTDSDPQLHYLPNTAFRVNRVVFSATATSKPSGEIALYYTTQTGDDFSEDKKIWAKQNQNGDWYFDLWGRKITGLRLDPDTSGGVVWHVNSIVLNEKIPPADYFIPSARAVFALVFFPPLVAAGLLEVLSAVSPYFARRRFDSRTKIKNSGK